MKDLMMMDHALSYVWLLQVMEKYLGMEELESIIKEAGQFMEQSNEEILVTEKNDRSEALTLSHVPGRGQDYMLNRFISEARSTAASRPMSFLTEGQTLKSMQHFFLKASQSSPSKTHLAHSGSHFSLSLSMHIQLGMIEVAMQNMHYHILEKTSQGGGLGSKPVINPNSLSRILSSYGLPHSEKEINRILTSCSNDVKLTLLNLEPSDGSDDDKSDDYYLSRVNTCVTRSSAMTSGGASEAAAAGGSNVGVLALRGRDEGKEDRGEYHQSGEDPLALHDDSDIAAANSHSITYEQFLTSMPFWEMIAVSY